MSSLKGMNMWAKVYAVYKAFPQLEVSQDICFALNQRQDAEPDESFVWRGTASLTLLIFWPQCNQKHEVKQGEDRTEMQCEDTRY